MPYSLRRYLRFDRWLRRSRRGLAPFLAVAIGLSACASESLSRLPEDFGDRSEKTLYAALREAEVSAEQRLSVLAIYDRHHPRLKALDAEAQKVLESWRALDRRSPEFASASADLAARWGELSRERVEESGALEHEVAAVLDEEQWRAWRERWTMPAFDLRERGYRGGGRGEPR